MSASDFKRDLGTPASPKAAADSKTTPTIESVQSEKEELLRVARFRSVFLARLAHELRTPLTSILGFSEILLNQEELSEPQRNFCERIQNSAHQMQNSLNQLSDLARVEVGEVIVASEDFSLAETVRESCDAVKRQADKREVVVTLTFDRSLPLIKSDRGRLRRAIQNILVYSILRSPKGYAIDVKVSKSDNDDGLVVLIADRGEPVVNPSAIGVLDLADDRCSTGDLGISIGRQTLQLLGASMDARNLDSGLELSVQLPLRSSQA